MNKNYMYTISGATNSNFHKFWVTTTVAIMKGDNKQYWTWVKNQRLKDIQSENDIEILTES